MATLSSLSVATAVADITPPLEVGLLTSAVEGTYAPFLSVRLPLKARVLALRHGTETVVWISLDLLALNDTSVGGWDRFKRALSADLDPEKIILTCTHTHSAPESVALSGLYRTESYRRWLTGIETAVSGAIRQTLAELQPAEVFFCSGELDGFSLQRRIPTSQGMVMSDSVQPITPELMARELVDRRVHLVRFVDFSGNVLATVVHAVCHPVHEMCMPHISPDFPGEMCRMLEQTGQHGMALFLNGAAGDTNPPTVSGGPACALAHGQALARLAMDAQQWTRADTGIFGFKRDASQLTARPEAGLDNPGDAVARCSALCIGPLAIVFLPGELFVETAFGIERLSPFPCTIVAGFGENNIGYLPTEAAFDEGGYETGPGKWSFLPRGSDRMLQTRALALLNSLPAPSLPL